MLYSYKKHISSLSRARVYVTLSENSFKRLHFLVSPYGTMKIFFQYFVFFSLCSLLKCFFCREFFVMHQCRIQRFSRLEFTMDFAERHIFGSVINYVGVTAVMNLILLTYIKFFIRPCCKVIVLSLCLFFALLQTQSFSDGNSAMIFSNTYTRDWRFVF